MRLLQKKAVHAAAFGAVTALAIVSAPIHASAASTAVKAAVKKGVLTVTGSAGADAITLRLRQGDASTIEVDADADGTADYAFDRSGFSSITVSGMAGADRLVADSVNGVFTDTEPTTLDGGYGDDVLIGTVASERLVGGAGDDVLTGGVGNDVLVGGDGADVITWEPGGGSDTVDGGAGTDQLTFQGGNVSEAIGLSATPAGHVRLTRDIGAVTLDVAGVEALNLRPSGGSDTITAGDLHGTGLATVSTDLSGSTGDDGSADEVAVPVGVVVGRDGVATVVDGLGAAVRVVNGGSGDRVHVNGTSAPNEQVTVAGTAAADSITASSNGTDVLVQGATPDLQVVLTGVDVLDIQLAGGDDSYATLGSVSGLTSLRVDGGEGADILAGGAGPEVLRGGAGDDTFGWQPGGGSDTIDGGAGNDRLAFSGGNIGEVIDLSASPDGHVRLARDIAGVVLDLAGIETADLRTVGGEDHVLVDDLSGTDLAAINVDLSSSQSTPDAQADEVVLFGTTGDDTVGVSADGGAVVAQGLRATVRVSGADPSLDKLTVYALRGNDVISATPDAGSLIQLALFP